MRPLITNELPCYDGDYHFFSKCFNTRKGLSVSIYSDQQLSPSQSVLFWDVQIAGSKCHY